MAALTLQSLDKVSFGNALTWEKKDAAVTSGYKAYLIPNEVRESVVVYVKVNSAANFNVAYTINSKQIMDAGTHEAIDVFGVAQTASLDVEIAPLASAIIITLNSGSIDIIVRAK